MERKEDLKEGFNEIQEKEIEIKEKIGDKKEKKIKKEKKEESKEKEAIITKKENELEKDIEINIQTKVEENLEEPKKEEKREVKPEKEYVGEEELKYEVEEINDKKLMPYESILKDYLDEGIDGTEIFDKKWYSNLEKDKIIYSKRSIIALINASFDDKNQEYKELYNKAPLIIAVNSNGSFLSNDYQVVRSVYTIKKDIYPPNTSIRMIAKYLNLKSWDTKLKLYKIIEGSEEGKEVKCILQNWLKSPMFLVSERDIIDKRFDFFFEGKFYSCESSVNDDYYPLENNVTRIYDFISIEELYEENDNFILKAISQINSKINLPQSMINATLSAKLLDFYEGLVSAMNNDYKEGKLIFEDNNGNIVERY